MRKLAMVSAVLVVGSTSLVASAQARAARFGVERPDVGGPRASRAAVDRVVAERVVAERAAVDRAAVDRAAARQVVPRAEVIRVRADSGGADARSTARAGAQQGSFRQAGPGLAGGGVSALPRGRVEIEGKASGAAEASSSRAVAGQAGSFPAVNLKAISESRARCLEGSPSCGAISREGPIPSPAAPEATGGSAVLMKAAGFLARTRDEAARGRDRLVGQVSRAGVFCALVSSEVCAK